MIGKDYIVSIGEIRDLEEFFKSLLSFYASQNVILTTWGKIPATIKDQLAPLKAPQARSRRLLFRENSFFLNEQSKETLIENLGQEQLLKTLSWGVLKKETPLCLCRAWDDINLDSSDVIDETILFEWLEDQRSSGVIASYEKITD